MTMTTLVVFCAATLVLLVIPGPAVMYIVTRSATQGRRAGMVSVAGIHLGTIVHIMAARSGLSAIVAASATAFTIVKAAGAVYLLWVGVQLRQSRRPGRNKDIVAGGTYLGLRVVTILSGNRTG